MTRKIVYPGTFDPLTRGHEDLVRRAARIFDAVVAVAANVNERSHFELDKRVEMARFCLAGLGSVTVRTFHDLLVVCLRKEGAHLVLRGLRAVSDFEYEFQLAGMNRNQEPELGTVFLTPADQYIFISASMVREIARLGGDVRACVHPATAERLAARRSG